MPRKGPRSLAYRSWPGRTLKGSDSGAWRPLLEGSLRERALEAVGLIADALPDPPDPKDDGALDWSFAGGSAGLAVLCTYLSRSLDEPYEGTAEGFLDHAGRSIEAEPTGHSLYEGFTGVAWATEHVHRQLSPEGEDPTEEVDSVLAETLSRSPWEGPYDLIGGLTGIGIYALERFPRGDSVQCLAAVIERLAETAEQNHAGITWVTDSRWFGPSYRVNHPERFRDVGVAHGVAGVIALLGRAIARDVAADVARPLLEGAVDWLLGQKLPGGSGAFPAWVDPDVAPSPTRSAWCYGDPGVSAALLVAGRAAGEPSWEREALDLARMAALRPVEETGVVDAGLCHGAAGLAHLFNRMHRSTGDPVLADAARSWFQRTLDMRDPAGRYGGFRAGNADDDGNRVWEDDPGFLTGAAGIALALLAAATPVEPEWDRVMAVSG